MHHLLPNPSLLRLLCRPLPDHHFLFLRPNPDNPHLPRHCDQCTRLRLTPNPKQIYPPPNLRLRPYRYRRPTRDNDILGIIQKKYFETTHCTNYPNPFTIPMPTLQVYQLTFLHRREW